MAYKPPKQSIVDNDLKGVPSNEAVFEALKLKLPKPSVDGTSGQLLSRGASADDTNWVNPPAALPSQSSQSEKVLSTDGTNAYWTTEGVKTGYPSNTIVFGKLKPAGLTGAYNTIIGTGTTANSTTTGEQNVYIGFNTVTNYNNSYAVSIGNSTVNLGDNTIAIGWYAQAYNGSAICIGAASIANDGTVVLGTSVGANSVYAVAVGRGVQAGNYAVSIGKDSRAYANSVSIGYLAGQSLDSGATGNIFIGNTAGDTVTTGSSNTIIGDISGTNSLSNTLILASGTTERIRHDNTTCAIQTGDLSIETVGKGLKIKTGANAKIGTAQFTAQSVVTVNTTAVTANSLIFVTGQDGVNSYAVQNKVVGTSFEIHHVGGNTTALVAWMIVEATP